MSIRKKFDLSAYLVVGPENTKGRSVVTIVKDAVDAGFLVCKSVLRLLRPAN